MKVALISDTHAHHWKSAGPRRKNLWPALVGSIVSSLELEKPDVLVDAGDYESPDVHDRARDLGIVVLTIPGNHDYYGSPWPAKGEGPVDRFAVGVPDGESHKIFAGATLWTDFDQRDPLLMWKAPRLLNDYRCAPGMTSDIIADLHDEHVDWLRRMCADGLPDVIVTHHAPTMASISERYRGEGITNYLFASALEDLVFALSPKVWVHGHVHDPCDYAVGGTRVVANPCGYPGERFSVPERYKPLYLDV